MFFLPGLIFLANLRLSMISLSKKSSLTEVVECSFFKNPISNGALWIMMGELLMYSLSSGYISSNTGLSLRKLFVSPCIFDASMSISLFGFIYLWKVLFVIFLFIISIHPISMILCPSSGSRPVVSVSKTIYPVSYTHLTLPTIYSV